MSGKVGPARMVLIASVARRHYLDGRSKVEIAAETGLSRFQVARLLDAARDTGVVRIEIASPDAVDLTLSSRLQDALGLRHAIVVGTPDTTPDVLLPLLGAATAELLAEIVTPDDVLGLAWSRSVSAMTRALTRLPPVPVVQLTGALTVSAAPDNSVDLVRQAARISGGAAHYFYAPTIVADAATARALRRHPEIARALGRIRTVTKAVVGIGSWAAAESTVYDAGDHRTRRDALREGACGEVSGILFDTAGNPISTGLADRTIGISADELRAVPEVIAIAYNVARAGAVRAAVRGGLVDSLVTHRALAHALIDPLDSVTGQ